MLELSDQIEQSLSELISSAKVPGTLGEAFTFVLFPGGKRIRPKFCLGLCAELGGQPSSIVPAALAIEILHTASLVHDDLPALDNDDMRRGRPACHKQFNESTALLLADFMVPFALEAAACADVGDRERVKITSSLSRAFKSLCVGQHLDLDREKNSLEDIYRLKTGALFRAAAEISAIGAHLDQTGVDSAGAFGEALGEVFQLVDDYRDRFGTDEERGRVGSSDARNDRHTAFDASDAGLKKGKELLRNVYDRALKCLSELQKISARTELNFSRDLLDSLCLPLLRSERK